ncbi:hypothetical protein [Bacillus velezensis]|uniref:hypothetical protein n=1 Tax=Bacillus velezensis TaxID=492670 RepID=UPI0019627F4F|nr:hypothetical protein [Bacillus velezensis]MBM7030601.1 hypothetical protein [Bacillus velezensis]
MKVNERIQYLLEMLNCAIRYDDSDSYDEIMSELKQTLLPTKTFDAKKAKKLIESQDMYRANLQELEKQNEQRSLTVIFKGEALQNYQLYKDSH